MSNKDELRKKFISARNKFPVGARKGSNMSITQRVLSSEIIDAAYCVMLYSDANGEVATQDIISGLLDRGKRVCLPFSETETVDILPCAITHKTELVLGSYGIFEPNKNKCQIVEPKDIDVVLVPGVAFDFQGYRLGYGKGYYDKFLPKLKQSAITIGLAYEFQISQNLPHEQHDTPVKFIFTDVRTIKCT